MSCAYLYTCTYVCIRTRLALATFTSPYLFVSRNGSYTLITVIYSTHLATMPHNGVSSFHYPRCLDQEPGSIWACTLDTGCDYEQHWTAAPYGGYVEMPLNYLKQVETMSFERIGTCKERLIGDQMRQLYRGVDWSYRFFVWEEVGKRREKHMLQ